MAYGDRQLVRSFRYRLDPAPGQVEALGQITGACRFVYNLAWEQRVHWHRQYRRTTGRAISYIGQSYELTELREAVDWLAALPRAPMEAALADLDRAFQAFLSGRGSYPRPRKRSQNCGFALRGAGTPVRVLNDKWAQARLQGVGWVKFRITRSIVGTPKIVTLREECGQWFISFAAARDRDATTAAPDEVGIDRGVANTLALSTGELLSLPATILAAERRRRKAQRVLARRVKGSRRRQKQRARVARLWARERRARADWLHRQSTSIVRRFGLVAVEALKIKNMTASTVGTVADPGKGVAQKRGLNRSILAQGWGTFERQLAYKLEASGGALIRVPAAYTSQTCSACGAVDHRSRESQAVFRCVHCGHAAHADTNAALEILRRSTSELLVEGARRRPDEARTMGVAA